MNQRLLSCLIFAATLILFLTPDSPFFRVLAARVPIISTVGGGGPAGNGRLPEWTYGRGSR
jgi:hypothetical protein